MFSFEVSSTSVQLLRLRFFHAIMKASRKNYLHCKNHPSLQMVQKANLVPRRFTFDMSCKKVLLRFTCDLIIWTDIELTYLTFYRNKRRSSDCLFAFSLDLYNMHTVGQSMCASKCCSVSMTPPVNKMSWFIRRFA